MEQIAIGYIKEYVTKYHQITKSGGETMKIINTLINLFKNKKETDYQVPMPKPDFLQFVMDRYMPHALEFEQNFGNLILSDYSSLPSAITYYQNIVDIAESFINATQSNIPRHNITYFKIDVLTKINIVSRIKLREHEDLITNMFGCVNELEFCKIMFNLHNMILLKLKQTSDKYWHQTASNNQYMIKDVIKRIKIEDYTWHNGLVIKLKQKLGVKI